MATNLKEEVSMNMNIIILSLLCISMVSISGCANTNADVVKGETGMTVNSTGEFKGVVSNWNFDLEKQIGVPAKGLIVDEKLALEIGNAVIKSVYNENVLLQTEFVVYELEDKDVFVVSRIPKGGETLGSDYNVAISKKDGAIIKIWAGE